MYLSRIALDVKRREAMLALASPQVLHGAVERSFNGDSQRILWRVDWLGDNCYLLVLSAVPPDFAHIIEQFGDSDSRQRWETKAYDPLLARLQIGQKWRFRLRANPVHNSSAEKDEVSGRGRVYAHVTQEQQRQWLLKHAEICGFQLKEDEFDVVDTQWKKFRKGGAEKMEVTLRMATFEGVLTISNPELFKQTLVSGIGRAKAYGCGLLTIARYGDDADA